MKKSQSKKVKNFKELVEIYRSYGENTVFKYKKEGEILEITYQQYAEDIKALRNSNNATRNRKSSLDRKQSI